MTFLRLTTYLLLLLILCPASLRAQDAQPYIETYADRTIIFPQRMQLHGDETLMDVLELYPEVLVPGYGDALAGYQLRMDNVKMLGEMRTLLTQIKAKDIMRVMIVDNPGVAKGKTGLEGVIDINMMPVPQGLGGYVEVQAGTEGYVLPALNLVRGTAHSAIYLNSSLGYTNRDHKSLLDQHVDLRIDNRLGKHDRLFVDFGQEYGRSASPNALDLERSLQGRLRYFHTFNDKGTELVLLTSLQSISSPSRADGSPSPMSAYRNSTETRVPIYLAELNTPLFSHRLSSGVEGMMQMMLGYEGNAVLQKTRQNLTAFDIVSPSLYPVKEDWRSNYSVCNNDAYLQLDYLLGHLRLTVGERIVHYHYADRSGNWRDDKFRNHFHASLILAPRPQHQVQAAYYHKYINPAFSKVFPAEWLDVNPSQVSTLQPYIGNPELGEAGVHLFKLTYGYLRSDLSLRFGTHYRYITDLPVLAKAPIPSQLPTWLALGSAEQWMFDASLFWRNKVMRLAAHTSCVVESQTTYCVLGLSPTWLLPYDIILGADFRYYSDKSPLRQAYGRPCYGSIRLDKKFASHLDVLAQWHDIFNPAHRAFLAGIRYNL